MTALYIVLIIVFSVIALFALLLAVWLDDKGLPDSTLMCGLIAIVFGGAAFYLFSNLS